MAHHSFIPMIAIAAAAGSGMAWLSPAMAQTGLSDGKQVLDEIMVTARKRAETLQDVPISITVFNEEMLERIRATELLDILHRTPNFYQPYLGEAKGTPPSIRGVQGTSTAGADPAVGFYIDEVYLGNTVASSFDLFDLESFEVLRGPQGTLFGRNTIGGVINIRTKKPTDEFAGVASLSYGNYNDLRLRGSISGPLVEDRLFGKVSALLNKRDGFIENENPGHGDLRELDNWFIRSQLRFVPGDATEVMVSFDYRKLDQRGGGYEADGQNVFFSGAIPGTGHLEFTFGDPVDFSVNWNCCGEEYLEAWGVSLDASHQLPGMELRSITAYRDHEYDSIFNTDLSPNDWVADGSPEDQYQFSQEFRLTSTTESRLSWIAGLFYFHQNSTDRNFITLGQDVLPLLGFPAGTPDRTAQANGHQKADSYAAYLHTNYAVTERLEVTVGGRLTHDRKSIDYVQTDQTGILGGGFAVKDSDIWTEFTGDASISYRWTPDVMTYASIARGYKAGGFNDGIGQADNPPFDPEYVVSYELGVKSIWLDGGLLFNINAYYLDWEDIQVAGFQLQDDNSFRRITGNFGDGTSKGIEAELLLRPVEGLEISSSLGVADGESETVSDNNLVATSSLRGPDYTLSTSAHYQHTVADYGHLSWYADYLLQGSNDLLPKSAVQPGMIEGPHQSTYGLVNARLTFTSMDEQWSLSLWGKNIADKTYKTQYFSFDGNALLTPGALVLGPPRMYGAEVRVNF